MTSLGVLRYALGTLELLALGGGCVALATVLRRRLLPAWDGPHALLATVVLALGTACLALQLLGATGLLYGPVLGLVGLLLLGAATALQRRSRHRVAVVEDGSGALTPLRTLSPARAGVVGALVGALAAVWLTEVALVVRDGVLDLDSLAYHLPFATEWAQTHRVGPVVRVSPGTPVRWYPGNSELLHAAALVAHGRDLVGPFLNLAWVTLLLLSAVCLGLRRGRVVGTVAATVLVCAGPLVAKFLPGGAMTDIASLASVLATAALLVELFDRAAGRRIPPAALAVAGVAAGLGVGTKLTVLPILGALTVGLLALTATRGRPWLGFVAGMCVPALFWYVRDLVLTGSPVPFLPYPTSSLFAENPQPVAHYWTDLQVLREVYLPQTYQVLGAAWWVLGLAAVIGSALALASRWRIGGLLAVAATVAAVAYTVTPTTAGGPEGRPLFFAVDIRYALPALLVGAVLLPLAAGSAHRRGPVVAETALCLAAVLTLLSPWRLLIADEQSAARTLTAGLVAGLAGAAVVALARRPDPAGERPSGRWTRPLAGAFAVAVLLAGYPLAQQLLDRRWSTPASPQAWRALRSTSGLDVAVTGTMFLQPYAGVALDNTVTYVGLVLADKGFEEETSCRTWRASIARGGFDTVAVGSYALAWVDDPAFTTLVEDDGLAVLRVTGLAQDSSCPSGSPP